MERKAREESRRRAKNPALPVAPFIVISSASARHYWLEQQASGHTAELMASQCLQVGRLYIPLFPFFFLHAPALVRGKP
jgi:hypothetical protein